jgi:hypothetical protein
MVELLIRRRRFVIESFRYAIIRPESWLAGRPHYNKLGREIIQNEKEFIHAPVA